MKKRVFCILLCLCMAVTLLPTAALAAEQVYGAFTVTGDDLSGVSCVGNVLTISSDKPVTIANTDPNTPTTDRIEVASAANITLAGVNIDVSGTESAAAFKIASTAGAVDLTLADGSTNTLKSGKNCAGLQKDTTADTTMLTLQGNTLGTGALSATGGAYGAGIGGAAAASGKGGTDGCYITISGGTVTAAGGAYGAGIGGGGNPSLVMNGPNGGNGCYITIGGGTVTATGGNWAAGIGGGSGGNVAGGGDGSNITISGGTVTATGGPSAAGIGPGAGSWAGATENKIISGGNAKTSVWGEASNGAVSVYQAVFTVPGDTTGGTDVSAMTFTSGGTAYTYNMAGARSILDSGAGKVYVYLPGDATGIAATASYGGKTYVTTVKNDGNAVFTVPPEAKWGIAGEENAAPSQWVASGSLTEAVAYANGLDGGEAYIQLQSDADTTATLDFVSGKTTVLDLNGKAIDAKQGAFSVITVNGTLTLRDNSTTQIAEQGKITGGNAESGGGVYVNAGSVTMDGGKITGNSATGTGQYSGGGGVFISTGSTFFLNSGSITGNTATGDGGGVNVNYGGGFTINGGSITGNSGGGIFVASTAMLTVGGTAQVTGNTKGANSDAIASNVYLTVAENMSPPTVTTLTVIPTLSAGAEIGITSDTAPTAGVPVAITGANSADYSGYFVSDNSAYAVIAAETNQLKLAAAAQPITKSAATNGSFTVKVNDNEVSSAVQGATVAVTPTADANYELDTITVTKTGDTNTTVPVTGGSFTMPAYPVTVTVSFRAIPAPPTGGTPSLTVPATSNAGSVNVDAALSGGTANISVTDAQLGKLASADGTDTGIVKVDASGLRADAAVIPAKLVTAAANASGSEGLEVAFSTGSVALDKTALDSIGSKSITVSVEDVKTTELTAAQKETLGNQADTAVIVDINVLVNGVKTSEFNGGLITVSVPYTPKAGEDTSKLVVWYLADDGTIEPMNGKYDAVSKAYVFTTTHLSTYVLTSFPFTDVAAGSYYYNAVAWAVANGTTEGTSAETFSPDDICTRAQTVTFFWRAMGSPEPTSTTCPFTDVDANAYYYKAVLWAAEKGITEGTSETTFSPNDTVTRAQVVTLEWRAAGKPAATAGSPFTDVASGAYYEDAVAWAVAQKIAEGTSTTTFSPADPCTRAQIVTFLYRYLAK